MVQAQDESPGMMGSNPTALTQSKNTKNPEEVKQMSEAKKKMLQSLESAAEVMTDEDAAYITGYADCAAANAPRDSTKEEEAEE